MFCLCCALPRCRLLFNCRCSFARCSSRSRKACMRDAGTASASGRRRDRARDRPQWQARRQVWWELGSDQFPIRRRTCELPSFAGSPSHLSSRERVELQGVGSGGSLEWPVPLGRSEPGSLLERCGFQKPRARSGENFSPHGVVSAPRPRTLPRCHGLYAHGANSGTKSSFVPNSESNLSRDRHEPENAACLEGARQSPLDRRDARAFSGSTAREP